MKYYRIGVEIKSDQGSISRVGGEILSPSGVLTLPNGILSYPDRMVSKFILYGTDSPILDPATLWSYVKYDAKQSNVSNLSYYNFAADSKTLDSFAINDATFAGAATISTAELRRLNGKFNRDANRVYVSNAYKPQAVYGRNAHYIGNDSNDAVMGFASNAQDISSGQFGQYPLYAFCKDSITAMEVGSGDVAFSKLSPIRLGDSLIGYEALMNYDRAILFVSRRGMEVLNDVVLSDNIQNSTSDSLDFLKNIGGSTKVGYFSDLPTGRKELWISTGGIIYAFSFTHRKWFTISGSFDKLFRIYDNTYSLAGGKIYRENTGTAKTGTLVIAPVHFGGSEILKRFRRVLVRYIGEMKVLLTNVTDYQFGFTDRNIVNGIENIDVEYEARQTHRERSRRLHRRTIDVGYPRKFGYSTIPTEL
jgi:hypothetical protein